MTRAQRAFHAWVWTFLGPLALISLGVALMGRPPLVAVNDPEPPIGQYAGGADAAPEVVP
ncbi:MAG: hypothetical protein HUU22_10735 [Phycisphaerae bacterium]|nr:hypothetical protein [Phycisphaerae bacterium]NUQ46497.1 hypothetical protein [Phycisphaerae bacterium]